jgi:hypothetical protein
MAFKNVMRRKMKTRIAGCLIILGIVSCSKQAGEGTFIDYSKHDFSDISLYISDYADNWQVVKLETTPECLIAPYYHIYPCNHSILIYTYDRILQFAYSGAFLREITRQGNGPNEVKSVQECIVDEKRDLLYWTDAFDSGSIHVFDLRDNTFKANIPIAAKRTLSAFRLIDDSTLLCFPYMGSKPQVCYFQDLNGNVRNQTSLSFENPEGPYTDTPVNIFSFDKEWFYQGIYEDTVFNATNRLATSVFYRGKMVTPETATQSPGQNLRFLTGVFYTSKDYILSFSQLELQPVGESTFEMSPTEQRYFVYDWSQKQAYEINSIFFEPLDKKFEKQALKSFFRMLSSLNAHKLVVNYPAENLPDGSEDENPVLFIGDIKNFRPVIEN